MGEEKEGILSRLKESIYKIRTVPRPDPEDRTPYVRRKASIPEYLSDRVDGGSFTNLNDLEEFRRLSQDRENLYKTFDEMMTDSEVSTVIEIYADEACQYNEDGKIIWAEAEDPEVAAFVNNLLDRLRIQDECWNHIYQLVYLGDLYLELFDNLTYRTHRSDMLTEPYKGNNNVILQRKMKGIQKQEYVEQVPNPANIYDLTYRGKTEGYIKIPDEYLNEGIINYVRRTNAEKDKLYILEPTKYVHICLKDNKSRYPETLILDSVDENGQPSEVQLTVRKGRSILEDVYSAYQNLKLMKDSLLLNRVNRSSRVRIMQVEVGDLPKNEKALMLKRLKDKVEQKNIMDKSTSKFQSMAAPGPIDNIIYTTMTNGKGQVSMSDLGENLNVSQIADLEPFENSFYGKLRVSKAILGANMEGSGLSNGGTLSQQDSIFARYIKRIQTAYISGIETLVNIFIISKIGHNNTKLLGKYLGKFNIKMTAPSTALERDRDESFKQKVDSIKQYIDLVSSEDIIHPKTKKEIIKKFTTDMLNKQEIASLLEEDDFLDIEEEVPTEEDEFDDGPLFNDEE